MIGAFRELFEIIKTNIRERKITKALAKIELKKEYNNSILGVAWAFIRPMVYVLVFLLRFFVDSVHYVVKQLADV